MTTIHIIGAGISGLAAALALMRHSDLRICIYEASGHAGGRCRSYHDATLDAEIDNGNHLLISANTRMLAMLDKINARHFWQAMPHYQLYSTMDSSPIVWKSPFYLPALPLANYRYLLRLVYLGRRTTVADLFPSDSLLAKQWATPLCIAAMNTLPDQASARLFRQMLCKAWRGATPIVATRPFRESLIDPLINHLRTAGVELYFHSRLSAIEQNDQGSLSLRFSKQTIDLDKDDKVILALPSAARAPLWPQSGDALAQESIINGHFRYAHAKKTPDFCGYLGGMAEWIFYKDGIISTTTSAANRYAGTEQDEIARLLWADICRVEGMNAPLPAYRIITEKRATFVTSVDNLARRPPCQTMHPQLFLAGDDCTTGLPASLESAVIAGEKAAKLATAKA